jgi:hypothetical protein
MLPYFEPVEQEVVSPPAPVFSSAAASITPATSVVRGQSVRPSPPQRMSMALPVVQEPQDVLMDSVPTCKVSLIYFVFLDD